VTSEEKPKTEKELKAEAAKARRGRRSKGKETGEKGCSSERDQKGQSRKD
jgi:hypothetical protein